MKDEKCKDKNCPKHGKISTRGMTFVGKVKRTSLGKNAVVEIERKVKIPKYERYEKRWTKLICHIPECLDIKIGDIVKAKETRKISKTKSFVIMKKVK